MNFKINTISKGKKVKKLWQKSFHQHKVNFKNYACVREREACNNKLNALVQCSSKSRLDTNVDTCP